MSNRKSPLLVRRSRSRRAGAEVALIISAWQPNFEASRLLRVALESMLRNTSTGVEIWVVDGASPKTSFKVSPDDYPEVSFIDILKMPRAVAAEHLNSYSIRGRVANLLASRRVSGSFRNGFTLDEGIRNAVMGQSKKPSYFMTLQMDVMFVKPGLIELLLSHFDDATAAVGVRRQRSFDKSEEILHSLGCMWKTSTFLELNESMLPSFPRFDVGEKAISEAKKKGLEIVGLPCSYSDASVESYILGTKFSDLTADRTLDDKNEVVFMHLGRGIPRSKGKKKTGTTIDEWVAIWKSLD